MFSRHNSNWLVCVHVYACIYVCMYVCMHACDQSLRHSHFISKNTSLLVIPHIRTWCVIEMPANMPWHVKASTFFSRHNGTWSNAEWLKVDPRLFHQNAGASCTFERLISHSWGTYLCMYASRQSWMYGSRQGFSNIHTCIYAPPLKSVPGPLHLDS